MKRKVGDKVKIKTDVITYKWVFNINEFKNNDIAINCESEEEAIKLFEILINNGITQWQNDSKLDINDTSFTRYKNQTCYEIGSENKLAYSDTRLYEKLKYQIYELSEIDFSQVWDKESINEVALNPNKETDFDITKENYITKEQLSLRGYKTGDILYDGESMSIVYGDKILHINDNCVETLNPKAFNYILPIELIESNSEVQRLLSSKLSSITSYCFNKKLGEFFIKIEEPPKLKTICTVKFTADTLATKGFILEDIERNVKEGDIVECCTSGNAYQYCRVVKIQQLDLSEHEINTYRTCRKLSL